MAFLVTKIKYIFKTYPLLANSAVYGTMCVTAELTQQIVTRKFIDKKEIPDPIDKAMLVRYAVIGSCINSNILYFWYKWLDNKYVGTASRVIIKKLLIDQFVMTPQLLAIFYISMSIMEGKSDILAECKEKLISTFKTSCLFWLPAQTVNFALLPPAARVVYVGACSFIWVNILCWIKREEMPEYA